MKNFREMEELIDEWKQMRDFAGRIAAGARNVGGRIAVGAKRTGQFVDKVLGDDPYSRQRGNRQKHKDKEQWSQIMSDMGKEAGLDRQ